MVKQYSLANRPARPARAASQTRNPPIVVAIAVRDSTSLGIIKRQIIKTRNKITQLGKRNVRITRKFEILKPRKSPKTNNQQPQAAINQAQGPAACVVPKLPAACSCLRKANTDVTHAGSRISIPHSTLRRATKHLALGGRKHRKSSNEN